MSCHRWMKSDKDDKYMLNTLLAPRNFQCRAYFSLFITIVNTFCSWCCKLTFLPTYLRQFLRVGNKNKPKIYILFIVFKENIPEDLYFQYKKKKFCLSVSFLTKLGRLLCRWHTAFIDCSVWTDRIAWRWRHSSFPLQIKNVFRLRDEVGSRSSEFIWKA